MHYGFSDARRSGAALIVVLAALLGSTLAPVGAAQARASVYATCPFAAHRGYTAHYTENGRRAFRAALRERANYLEMDVQVTSDGRFVLMHDETINRTTHGGGKLINKPWSRVHNIRLNDGERIPSLHSVLRIAKPTHANVLLEMKWIPEDRWAKFIKQVHWFGTSRVVVHSFERPTMLAVHADYPDVHTAVDIDQPISVAKAEEYGGVLPDYHYASNTWLAQLQAADVPTYVWTVDSPHAWRRLKGRVTLVITDDSAAYLRFRRRHC